MKRKKQIDRLFKEQFKHLEATPPPSVWKNIEAALQKEKDNKRVVPLWYKLAGVAATLLIVLGIGSLFLNTSDSFLITFEDSIESTDNQITELKENLLTAPEKNSDGFVESHETRQNTSTLNTLTTTSEQESTIRSERVDFSNSGLVNKLKNTTTSKNSESVVQVPKTTLAVASKTIREEKIDSKGAVVNTPAQFIEAISLAEATIQEAFPDKNKKSLIDYIEEKNTEDNDIQDTERKNKWEVSPNFAPVYYNSIGEGSSIDPQFSKNTKSGDINYSYGVKVSYAFNDRLSVRTGINNLEFSYITNNIEFSVASSSESGLHSVNYINNEVNLAIGTRGSLTPPPSDAPIFTDGGIQIVPRNGVIPGSMKQKLNYFEIPLELKYKLSNNRIGINLIGGMSTLLLNDNKISVLSNGFQSEIGSANNLNNISFSTNIGLGIDYKISKSFLFNIEPMFKYQFNTYSESTVDFKPYNLGVYSGFSYKF